MSFLNPSKADRRRRFILVGGSSVIITGIVMYGFLIENRSGYMKPDDKIIYAESWPEARTRDDAIADTQATQAAREEKLANARAFIATLSGEQRKAAQDQYDAYVAGDAIKKDIPYVPAAGSATGPAASGSASAPSEPPVM